VIWPEASALLLRNGSRHDTVKITTRAKKNSLLAGFLISKTGRNTLVFPFNSLYC
jgi:hypothetical protein